MREERVDWLGRWKMINWEMINWFLFPSHFYLISQYLIHHLIYHLSNLIQEDPSFRVFWRLEMRLKLDLVRFEMVNEMVDDEMTWWMRYGRWDGRWDGGWYFFSNLFSLNPFSSFLISFCQVLLVKIPSHLQSHVHPSIQKSLLYMLNKMTYKFVWFFRMRW